MNQLNSLPAPVRISVDRWHSMIAAEDLADLHQIIHADAKFRSPMAFKSYNSREAVVLALHTAFSIFQDFRYHRQLASDDGHNVMLEFSAFVGDKSLKGIDLIQFDEQGLIVEVEVMLRPMSGLQAMGTEMAKRIGGTIGQYKL